MPSVELFSWERSVELEFALPAAHLPVACDRQRVLQVLSNFLGNAIKFTPEGGRVLLRVERRGDEADFSVRDTGPGIPADQLPHVFERFWRADRKSQRSTGLGLFIARSLVQAHSGRIWAESEVGWAARSPSRFPCCRIHHACRRQPGRSVTTRAG